MTENKHFGICRLCGEEGKLSFEHIPPESAFNNTPLKFETLQSHLQGRGKTKFRQGLGDFTLCERCNTTTGGWYGKSFANWTVQGMKWLKCLPAGSSFELPFDIMPLNVLKQVLVMMVAMSPLETINYHTELREFLLSRTSRYLPSEYAVYAYFNSTGQPRFVSGVAVANTHTSRVSFVEAEVCLPPLGYCVVTPSKNKLSLADERGLTNITWFSRYEYNIWTRVYVKLPVLETNAPFPLNY